MYNLQKILRILQRYNTIILKLKIEVGTYYLLEILIMCYLQDIIDFYLDLIIFNMTRTICDRYKTIILGYRELISNNKMALRI